MKKSEIEINLQQHIQAFKETHHWHDRALEVCYRKISEEILIEVSENEAENTNERMLEIANSIDKHIELFAIEWGYQDQYPPFLNAGMSKVEIVARIQDHIKTFEAEYDWSSHLIRACIAGAKMYIFHQIPSEPEKNTKKHIAYISEQLNEMIEQLVEDTVHQDKGAVFSPSDLYPNADNPTEKTMDATVKNMKI
jgi:hypothetical protein